MNLNRENLELLILKFKQKKSECYEIIVGKFKLEKNKKANLKTKPFGPVKFKKLYKEGLDKWSELQSDVIKKNIERNKKLVLLDKEQIPEYIQEKIMKEYNNMNISFKKEEIEEYFKLTDMESFYGKANEFNPKSYKIFF